MIKNVFARLILLVVSVTIVLYCFWDYKNVADQRFDDSINVGTAVSQNIKESLDSVFSITKSIGDQMASKLANKFYSKEELEKILKDESLKGSFITGVTVAFEPQTYFKDDNLYGQYYHKSEDKFYRINDFYDFRIDTLMTSKWYSETMRTGESRILDPYYGEVAKEFVIDYVVPIKLDASKNEIVGVLTITISLNRLSELVRILVDGSSGYVFLTNRDGTIIAHPNRRFIMTENVMNFDASLVTRNLISRLLNQENGYFDHLSSYTGANSTFFFNTTEMSGWKVVVVYSTTDLLGDPKEVERKIINLSMGISLVILLIFLFFFRTDTAGSIWRLAISIGLVFIVNMVLIWTIQLDIDYSEELSNRTRVYSSDALSSFVASRQKVIERLGIKSYRTIPTGIEVNELLVTDSYDMGVTGRVWQKWPKEYDLPDNIGFEFDQAFPGGRSVFTELESKELIDGDTWLYRWKFSAKLRIFFDYSKYPLDQHYIDIRLSYPDPTEDIMLVPDFSSYEVLNPSAKPGLNDLIFVPQFRIIASYFSFFSTPVKTFYGKGSKLNTPELEKLEYNIVIKRRFLTPFVSFIIPFVLGSGMIFFLLFSLSNDENDKSGVTVMGAVQGMAALFFGMLLTHITIRNRIPTPVITYLESFYFIIYTLIISLILIVVVFKKYPNHRFFGYRDNLIAKALYWPVLFALLFVITLVRFY